MKFLGIVGSISDKSYNKRLMDFAKFKFDHIIDLEIIDIKGLPMFSQDLNKEEYPIIDQIGKKIEQADGIIIATPEHNFTIPAVLKSMLEWYSYELHPFKNKPVLILGASYTEQGTSRAQSHLKMVLDSPGVDAYVIPGSEFLLNNAKEKFDEDGFLIDERTIDYLEHVIIRFKKFTELANQIDISNIESSYTRTLRAGGYESTDPYSDGTSGASEL